MAQTESIGARGAKTLDSGAKVGAAEQTAAEPKPARRRLLIEMADGKTTTVTAYYDGISFGRQIGLMPMQGSAPEPAMTGAFNAATTLRRAVAARTSGR